MMHRLLLLALMLTASTPAAADEPLLPMPAVPDHVVTMSERAIHRKEDLTRTVTHRGDWTRVDKVNPTSISTEYYQRNCSTFPRHVRDKNTGIYTGVWISRGCHRSPDWDYNPVRTDERRIFLGESCTVWTAWQSARMAGSRMVKTSCVTEDGIELWYKITSGYGLLSWADATKVERRPVSSAEAEPPADLLKIDHWFTESAPNPANTTPDFEMVMRQDGAPEFARTVKRHGGWLLDEERAGGARQQLSISNPAAGYWLSFHNLVSGTPFLGINQNARPRPAAIDTSPDSGIKRMDRVSETVLGEQCIWFDMAPGAMHGAHYACRTDDGVALREEWIGERRERRVQTATVFVRRTIMMEEIKPPAELMQPKTWGLPE